MTRRLEKLPLIVLGVQRVQWMRDEETSQIEFEGAIVASRLDSKTERAFAR